MVIDENIFIDVSEAKKLKSYTVMSNSHFRDPRKIGLKAMGLMSFMISLPENWNYSIKGLAKCTGEGEDSIRNTIKKLEEYGYLTRIRERDEKGCFTKNKYILYLEPRVVKKGNQGDKKKIESIGNKSKENIDFYPEAQKVLVDKNGPKVQKVLVDKSGQKRRVTLENIDVYPASGFPALGSPTLVNPTQINTKEIITKEIKEKEINKEKEISSFSLCVFDSDFSKFWSEYPRKEKKDRAKKAFLKKRKAGVEFNTILDGLKRHKQKWAQENTKLKYIPHPASWINDERWNDEIVISKNEGESGYNINSYEKTMDVFDAQVKKDEEDKKKQEQEQAKLKEILARDHDKNVERYGKQFAEDLETSESIEDYYDFVNDYERRMSKGLLPNGDYPPELSYLENNLFESPEERARAIEYALSGAHRL